MALYLSIGANLANAMDICQQPFEQVCDESAVRSHREIVGKLKGIVRTVRWEALNELGYTNWREFFNSRYAENGLIAPKYNLKKLKVMRGLEDWWLWKLSSSESIPQIESCEKGVESLFTGLQYNSPLGEFRVRFPKVLDIIRSTRREELRLALSQGKHSIELYNEVMENHCDSKEMKNANKELCEKFKNLKVSFLLAPKKDHLDESLFEKVEETLNQLADNGDHSYLSFSEEILKEIKYSSLSNLQKRHFHSYTAKKFCTIPGAVKTINTSIKSAFDEYLKKVFSSKPVIEKILTKIYDPSLKSALEEDFSEIKENIVFLVNSWNIPEETKLEIANSFAGLQLNWPTLPENKFFKEDEETGLLILDEQKIPMSNLIISSFVDPELEILSTVNAFYLPHVTFGKVSIHTQVNMLPYFLELYKTNPEGVKFVMAHEAGHNIDFDLAEVNDFEGLQSFYSKIFDCYSSSESFKMSYDQAGETLADFIASEVMSLKMGNQIDENIRIAKKSLAPFCVFDSMKSQLFLSGSHPEPYFRISAVSLANPSVRTKLRCETPQENFKSCGLK